MDLHAEVLAGAERAADAAERDPHLVGRQVEAGGDLVAVDVQPLGRHEQVDAAVLGGHREAGLGAEERLVLHPDLVVAGDHDVGGRVGSPCSMCTCRSRLPDGCSGSASSAFSGSVIGGRLESTSIRAAARRAVSGWSAATIAIGSPW